MTETIDFALVNDPDRSGSPFGLSMRYAPRSARPVAESRVRVQQWVLDRELITSPDAFAWYCAWGTHEFVGNAYPFATAGEGEGMDLVGKFMATAILLDDQLDELKSAAECSRRVRPFLEIIRHDGALPESANRPLHAALAEVVSECRERMPESWWRRAALHWEASLIAIVQEIADRTLRGGPAPRDIHLAIRRPSGFMEPFLDIIEPATQLLVPAVAFHSPQIAILRRLVVDIGNAINDLLSLDKEIARGQYSNLVLVLGAETGVSPEAAADRVREIVKAKATRFRHLRAELPQVCELLELRPVDREHTLRYADALEFWVAGYERWHVESPRYRQALTQRPATGPWACEDLLTESAAIENAEDTP